MAEVFYAIHKRDMEKCMEAASDPKANKGPNTLVGPSATPQIPGGPRPMPDNPVLGGTHCCVPNPPCNTMMLGADQPINPPIDKIPVADTLYARVVDIWCEHLSGIVRSLTYRPVVPEGIGAVVAEITQENVETLGTCSFPFVSKKNVEGTVHNTPNG